MKSHHLNKKIVKKTFPCKTCISFVMCKSKYINSFPFINDRISTIRCAEILVIRLFDECVIMREWYCSVAEDKFGLYDWIRFKKKINVMIFKWFYLKQLREDKPIYIIANKIKNKIRKMLSCSY